MIQLQGEVWVVLSAIQPGLRAELSVHSFWRSLTLASCLSSLLRQFKDNDAGGDIIDDTKSSGFYVNISYVDLMSNCLPC